MKDVEESDADLAVGSAHAFLNVHDTLRESGRTLRSKEEKRERKQRGEVKYKIV